MKNSVPRIPSRQSFAEKFYQQGTVEQALMYARLFMPNFVEIFGNVFLDDGYHDLPDLFLSAKKSWTRTEKELVDSCNWREITSLFRVVDVEDGVIMNLAEYLVIGWRARLEDVFPQRIFEVRVLPETETGGGIGVGFEEIGTHITQ